MKTHQVCVEVTTAEIYGSLAVEDGASIETVIGMKSSDGFILLRQVEVKGRDGVNSTHAWLVINKRSIISIGPQGGEKSNQNSTEVIPKYADLPPGKVVEKVKEPDPDSVPDLAIAPQPPNEDEEG